MNIRTLSQFLFGLMLMHGGLAQGAESDRLATLQKDLAVSVSKIQARYNDLHVILRENYTKALGRLEKELAPDGNLNPILVVRKEKTAVGKVDEPLPELPNDVPPKLLALRKKFDSNEAKYAQQRDAALGELRDEHDRQLLALEKDLTRSGKLDGAMAIRSARDALAKDARFPEAALAIQLERDMRELTRNLEESTWEWRITDRKALKEGLFLRLRKGGVAEFSWNPERGRWKVVSASEVEFSCDRWDKLGIVTFDKGFKHWELRWKGEDEVVRRGRKTSK